MPDQRRRRATRPLEAAVKEQLGRFDYQRPRGTLDRQPVEPMARARPLQYDESGFPIEAGGPSLAKRVTRLLSPF
jgi:hypothetical protein